MSATSPPAAVEPNIDEIIRVAQEEMARAVQLGGLHNDPIRYTFAALLEHLRALQRVLVDGGQTIADNVRLAQKPLSDKDLHRLETAAVTGADRRAAELARAHNYRTVLLAAAVFVGAAVAAGASGFWWGRNLGRAEVAATAEDLRAAFSEGAPGASRWRSLVMFNNIEQAMASCEKVSIASGQPACKVALWTGPPPAPGGKP